MISKFVHVDFIFYIFIKYLLSGFYLKGSFDDLLVHSAVLVHTATDIISSRVNRMLPLINS